MNTAPFILAFACVALASTSFRHIVPEGLERDLRAIHFVDSENGSGQDVRGGLWLTQNGGQTWSPMSPAKEAASTSDTAYKAISGAIFKTVDGGQTWTNVSVRVDRVFFSGVAVPKPNKVFGVGMRGALLKSSDGGQTWRFIASGSGAWLRAIAFVNPDEGYVVGDSGVILRTLNGGATWERQKSGTNKPLVSISCPHSGTCFIAGEGVLLKSTASAYRKRPFALGQTFGLEGKHTFWYQVQEKARVNIALIDAAGKKKIQLVEGFQEPGRMKLALDNKGLPSGRYYLMIRVGQDKARLPIDLL